MESISKQEKNWLLNNFSSLVLFMYQEECGELVCYYQSYWGQFYYFDPKYRSKGEREERRLDVWSRNRLS